jgi:hypothetical protein
VAMRPAQGEAAVSPDQGEFDQGEEE